jgi:hypothetical protein
MIGPGRTEKPPHCTLESITFDDETVGMLTQANNTQAWIQSDTVVPVDP